MIVEMHCHTSERSACSHVRAKALIQRVIKLGLNGIVLTDHHCQWSDEDLAELREEAGAPEVFVLLSGQEYKTADFGDVLIYGLKHTLPKDKRPLAEIREENPEAAYVWAHPYRYSKAPDPEKLASPLIDAVEIFNSNYSAQQAARALRDWHQYRYNATAGTDTHGLSYAGTYPTIFDHPFSTIEGLVIELKSGHYRPFFKEIPRSGATQTQVHEVTIGPKEAERRETMVVKTYQDIDEWTKGERSQVIVEEIWRRGFDSGPYRVPKPLDKDAEGLSLIEQRVDGRTLYDSLLEADPSDARELLRHAGRWLATLHNLRLRVTPENEFAQAEPERLDKYTSALHEPQHPHCERVEEIREAVWQGEQELLAAHPDALVQGHGDFHHRNIYVGQDSADVPPFVSAIDFNSSYVMPRAFDLGTFLAQHISMYYREEEVRSEAPGEIVLESYLDAAEDLEDDFTAHVDLYKARACLSILYYLQKVGMGDSEEFWHMMLLAEHSLGARGYHLHRQTPAH